MKTIGKIGCFIIFLLFGGLSAQAQNFGAIAYSPGSGGHGYSYDYPSKAAAQNRAMAECRKRARGCRVAIWFKNACGAVASGPSGWGSGWANTRNGAELQAIKSCNQHSAGCRIRVYACTTR